MMNPSEIGSHDMGDGAHGCYDSCLHLQEVNSSLEDSTTSLLSDIPRVVTEIQGLNNEAVLLRNQMSLVKCDINKVQEETSESMSSVVRLDRIKDRMLCTKRKLKQADNWCILNDQIDQLFEDQVESFRM